MPFYPHDLKAGVDVFSHDGHKLGTLHRVVLKRSDLSLTHIVVDIGFLRSGRRLWQGGLGLDYDRLVPVDQVHAASDERVETGNAGGDRHRTRSSATTIPSVVM